MSVANRQYKTRKSAINALKQFTKERSYYVEGEAATPAEFWLLTRLVVLTQLKKEGWTNASRLNWEFRRLKSIARGLDMFPLPDWAPAAVKVRLRLTGEWIPQLDVILKTYE